MLAQVDDSGAGGGGLGGFLGGEGLSLRAEG